MPTTGVASGNDIEWDAVETLTNYDPIIAEHLKKCKEEYHDGPECDFFSFYEPDVEYYHDGKVIEMDDDGFDFEGATIILKVNRDYNTVQVLLSPTIETHGRCSPCYPGQADLDAKGDIECYALPDDYLTEERLIEKYGEKEIERRKLKFIEDNDLVEMWQDGKYVSYKRRNGLIGKTTCETTADEFCKFWPKSIIIKKE